MDSDAWNSLYRILRQLGYPRPEIGYTGPNGKGSLQVAWPDREVGIAVPELDDPTPFRRLGWEIISLNLRQLANVAPLLNTLDSLSFAHQLATSRLDAKSTVSKTEQRFLHELLRLGLPTPDRNVSIIDDETGQILTVPDFAWTHGAAKLAVFVDGYYFHGGQDRKAILELASEDPQRAAELERSERDKLTRDADARRFMTAHGWVVIAVTDTEIDDPEERIRAATEVRAAWDRLRGASPTPPPQSPPPAVLSAVPEQVAVPQDEPDRSADEQIPFDIPEWAR